MIATIILGIFAVLFAFLAKYKNFKYGLEISFFLIFLFLALRYNFGNDYHGYLRNFIEVNRYSPVDFFDKTLHFEPGWIFLCRIFNPFGFYSLIAFHSLLFCIVYYYFFKKYVPANFYWLSILIFIFNPTFLLIQLSALRQSLAVILIILSYQYIYRKKIWPFILCIASASLFHTSALIFLPAYLLNFYKRKINIVTALVIFLSFYLLIFFGYHLFSTFSDFVNNYFERYYLYMNEEKVNFGSGFGLAYNTLLLLLTLYVSKFQKDENALIFNLAIISFLIISIVMNIMMFTRLSYYFQPAILVSLPIIINYIKFKPIKILITLLIIAASLWSYYRFLNSETWHDAYIIYKTIFSVIT